MAYPSLLHPEPLFLWQTTTNPHLHRRCSNIVLSQSLWGPLVLLHTRVEAASSDCIVLEWREAKRKYPTSKVRSNGCTLLDWLCGDTPHLKSEKPQ